MAKVLWSATNPGRADFLPPVDLGVGNPSNGTVFVFRPGEPDPQGTTFATWATLTAAYQADRVEYPSRPKTIAFDDSLAAINIPAFTGPISDDNRFTYATKFVSARPGRQIPIAVDNDVIWEIEASPEAVAIFQSQQIAWTRAAGISALSWIRDSGAGTPATTIKLDLVSSAIKNAATAPMIEAFYAANAGFDVDIVESTVELQSTGTAIKLGAAAPLSIRARAQSLIQQGALESNGALASLSSEVDVDSQLGHQPDLGIPAGDELNGPAASLNVRPSPMMVVLSASQLKLTGGSDIPQILQAFFFGLVANPTANDAVSFTDGTVTETFVFKAAAGAPFEVTIGISKLLTLINLAVEITASSTLWKGALVQSTITDQLVVAVIRQAQTVESYPDRAFTALAFVTGTPYVGGYRTADKITRLSYAQPVVAALPVTDPGYGIAGFSTVAPLLDGTLVSVLDSLTDGIYQAFNPIGGAGNGTWSFSGGPIDAAATAITGAGTTLATRQTRIVVATLAAAAAAILALPPTFVVGIPLLIRRTDADGASSLTLTPVTGTIDGLASTTVAVTSGTVIAFDGTNWHTMAVS